MASDGRPDFDPKEIARAAFPTAFRGYDQESVRRYLRGLAAAVAQAQQHGLIGSLRGLHDEAQLRVAELEQEAVELQDRVEELEGLLQDQPDRRAGAGGRPERELDEAELIAVLGQETARVLETARSAAADTVHRAEAEAAAATEQAGRDAQAAREEADAVLAAARADAGGIMAAASAEVRKSEARMKADTKRSRDQAKARADELVAEAQREAEAELAAARQRVSEIVSGAEQLRAELLGDLAQRRRASRQQLDRLVAARDRLGVALGAARSELDDIAAEIQLASPEQAEIDLTAGPEETGPPAAAELAELLARLEPDATEAAAASTAPSAAPSSSSTSSTSLTSSIAGPGTGASGGGGGRTTGVFVDEPSGSAGEGAIVGVTSGPAANGSDAAAYDDPDDVEHEHELDEQPTGVAGSLAEGTGGHGATVDVPVPGDDFGEAELDPAPDMVHPTWPERPGLADRPAPPASAAGDDDLFELDELGWSGGPLLGAGRGSLHRAAMRGDLPRNTPYGGNLPVPFEARDFALSRATPGFRRRLKRAVNDDQSDVLDRLRAGRGVVRPGELPVVDDQLDAYVEALRPVLVDMVRSGGELLDSLAVPTQAVENLCLQLAKHLVECVRLPTVDAIEEASTDDREAILDPIRAIYRDFRNGALPDLIDDALHEAFALGVYYAVEPAEMLIWIPDPRLDPDPICEENSAAPPLAKGTHFPSGHARPLSMPGCRCLALPMG
jgi:DivIVA domain-containing protein